MGKKKGKSKGGVGGGQNNPGGCGASSTPRSFCAESAAAVSKSAGSSTQLLEEPWKRPPDREDAARPTLELEAQLAKKIASELVEKKVEINSEKLREPVPNVDLPSVVDQMQGERDRFFGQPHFDGSDTGTYHRLARYGVFLRHVRERLLEEHKKATQKQKVAKALADRARGEREWSQRQGQLTGCNAQVSRLADAAQKMSAHVTELQASPIFIRAMAETRARDMVCPGWDRSWMPAKGGGGGGGKATAGGTQPSGQPPQGHVGAAPVDVVDDGLVLVEDGISFEDLLRLEEDRGM